MGFSEEEAHGLIATILKSIPEEAPEESRSAIVEFIRQWRAEIEAGRPVDRKLKVQESPGFDEIAGVPRSRTSTTGDFVGKKEYSQVEQLDLLIEALGLAFVAPPIMASRFLDTIDRYRPVSDAQNATPFSVALAETGEVGEPALLLDRRTVMQSFEATQPLAVLLEELSHEDGLRERPLTRNREAI